MPLSRALRFSCLLPLFFIYWIACVRCQEEVGELTEQSTEENKPEKKKTKSSASVVSPMERLCASLNGRFTTEVNEEEWTLAVQCANSLAMDSREGLSGQIRVRVGRGSPMLPLEGEWKVSGSLASFLKGPRADGSFFVDLGRAQNTQGGESRGALYRRVPGASDAGASPVERPGNETPRFRLAGRMLAAVSPTQKDGEDGEADGEPEPQGEGEKGSDGNSDQLESLTLSNRRYAHLFQLRHSSSGRVLTQKQLYGKNKKRFPKDVKNWALEEHGVQLQVESYEFKRKKDTDTGSRPGEGGTELK